jgi:hypothetical protein
VSTAPETEDVTLLSDAEIGLLLQQLEGEEESLSKRRVSLHNRIEFVHAGGAASPEQLGSLKAAERELSDRRLILHQQIDELRAERSRRLLPRSSA